MANPTKPAVIQADIAGTETDLYPLTSAANVLLNGNTRLDEKLSELVGAVNTNTRDIRAVRDDVAVALERLIYGEDGEANA